MTSYTQDGTVGPWAAEKLTCLEKYLSAYTTILRNNTAWCRGYFYVDAFAGPGRSKLRNAKKSFESKDQFILDIANYRFNDEEKAEYINGSPRTALGIRHPFSRYFFIDNDPDRIVQLLQLKQEFSASHHISVLQGDANIELRRLVKKSNIDWRTHRAVVLLDPFGMQVSWDTLEVLSTTGAIEAIINLPVGMAIQRLLPQSGQFTEKQRQMLTSYFGSDEWERIIYRRSTDLFGEEHVEKIDESGKELANWYRKRLKSAFGYVARPRLICNSRGGHLYYLLFAGPKQSGAKIADQVLNQGQIVR